MGRTELMSYGVNESRLNDKQRHFVMEYLVDSNGSRAAESAGYSTPSVAASKLLKKPLIARAIGRAQQITVQNLGLDAEEVLYNLWCCVTRSLDDFIDENGKIINDVKELTDRAKRSIDGIEQTVTIRHLDDGSSVETIRNKLRLVSKASALDMAMKHKGLFAPDKTEHLQKFNWDPLYEETEVQDPIESAIREATGVEEEEES